MTKTFDKVLISSAVMLINGAMPLITEYLIDKLEAIVKEGKNVDDSSQ